MDGCLLRVPGGKTSQAKCAMSNADPSFHRRAEERLIAHIERLLADGRLPTDALRGRRTTVSVKRGDRAVEVKRLMADMGRPDRELQAKMPVGQTIEVE